MIRWGKPVLHLSHRIIKFIALAAVILNIWNIFYSIDLFISALKIKINIGDYINMVSTNDGNLLPTLLIIPGVLCIPLNIVSIYLIYKVFSKKRRPTINTLLYALIMVSLGSLLTMLIMCIMTLSHAYSSSEAVHDGILEAMQNYNSNSLVKIRLDELQMQFQCCGSKHYTEWFAIRWYDTKLMKNDDDKHQTPFSCCSIKSIFPCIHHGIDSTMLPYRYSHELNFSISSHGCYTVIRKKKKSVGWNIVGKILVLMFFQLVMVIGIRLLQTAHFEKSRLDDENATYLCWLFGFYAGKKHKVPPPVPPVPKELME